MIPISHLAKALIFDCDGTLADSLDLHWSAWHATFAEYGTTCPQEFLIELNGRPTPLVLEEYNKRFGKDLPIEIFVGKKEVRVREKLNTVRPITPVVKIIQNNVKLPSPLPMAVASGSSREDVETMLTAIGVRKFIDVLVTSSDKLPAKPSPAAFLRAAERVGVDPKFCQMFEDADLGLQAGKAAGMICTDVRPFLQT